MKKIVIWLADHGFEKLSEWLCEKTGGHREVFYNVGGLEPDTSCEYCTNKG